MGLSVKGSVGVGRKKAKQLSPFHYFTFSPFVVVHYSDEISDRELMICLVKVVDIVMFSII